jgi:anti-sigma28 factor (negative regulator of flagellin synthesis)
MKVNDTNAAGLAGLGRASEITTGTTSTSRGRGTRSSQEDQVSLSNLGSALGGTQQTESPQQTVRLNQLSSDVRGGRYTVDAQAVSSSLVQDSIRA